MTSENFVYWLQGCLELSDSKTMNETQVQIIKDHLAKVLTKETPVRYPYNPGLTVPYSPGITLPSNLDLVITC